MDPQLDKAFRLDGLVAAVTGGGSGIGKAACAILAEAGAQVAVIDRDDDGAKAVAEEIVRGGRHAFACAADVSAEASIESVMTKIVREVGRIDILVNNAGLAIRKPSVELPLDEWEKVMAVNMTGAFLCARVAARYMIAAGRGGAIVNTTSIMSLLGGGLFPYISFKTRTGG